jgi:aminoglycoside phosphotransferase (APT) family kinase protein
VAVPAQRTPVDCKDLDEACALAGLPARPAQHLRSHANESWLLIRPVVVVRLSVEPGVAAGVSGMMRLVRWLVEQDLPVAAPWAPHPGPVTLASGRVATFWRALRRPESPDYRTFGRLLRRIHQVPPPDRLALPALDPVKLASAILDVDWPRCGVPRDFAADRLAELADRIRCSAWPLPDCLVHGDAHIGNLLMDGDRPVLGDWDAAAFGTPGWDLVPTAVEPQRWARPPAVYRAFADGYGADVTAWPGYAQLRELAEWHRIAERIRIAARVPYAGRNICRHLATMRAGDVDAAWYGAEVEAATPQAATPQAAAPVSDRPAVPRPGRTPADSHRSRPRS